MQFWVLITAENFKSSNNSQVVPVGNFSRTLACYRKYKRGSLSFGVTL